MKSPRSTSTCNVVLACALAGFLSPAAASLVDLRAPVGQLDVQRKHVRSGGKVELNWKIVYPLTLADVLNIDPRGRFKTTRDLDVAVYAIGGEYINGSHDNGGGNNEDGVDCSNPVTAATGVGPNGEVDASGTSDDELHTNGNSVFNLLNADAAL